MKRTLIFLLAASLFLITPAVAAAAPGGGPHGGPILMKKEKTIVYKTTKQRDYRNSRSYQRPLRHVPAHGYYRNHPAYRHPAKKQVKHRAPSHNSSVLIGVPSIVVRIKL